MPKDINGSLVYGPSEHNPPQKGLYWKMRQDMKNAPVYIPGEFRIELDKKVFEEDYINYEYKQEDGMYTRVESSPENKELKRKELENELKDRENRNAGK